jgi:hypothetical protein
MARAKLTAAELADDALAHAEQGGAHRGDAVVLDVAGQGRGDHEAVVVDDRGGLDVGRGGGEGLQELADLFGSTVRHGIHPCGEPGRRSSLLIFTLLASKRADDRERPDTSHEVSLSKRRFAGS